MSRTNKRKLNDLAVSFSTEFGRVKIAQIKPDSTSNLRIWVKQVVNE
jgi:hypothetical protein